MCDSLCLFKTFKVVTNLIASFLAQLGEIGCCKKLSSESKNGNSRELSVYFLNGKAILLR